MRDNVRNSLARGTPSPASSAAGAPSNVHPLHITVRFLSLPDIQLDISNPDRVTVAGMKPMVRAQLLEAAKDAVSGTTKDAEKGSAKEAAAAAAGTDGIKGTGPKSKSKSSSSPSLADAHKRTLRFFYGGKMLFDRNILSTVIRPVAPPPRNHTGSPASSSDGGHHSKESPESAVRVYVSCSLGDLMTERELLAEVVLGSSPPESVPATSRLGTPGLAPGPGGNSTSRLGTPGHLTPGTPPVEPPSAPAPTSTTPVPRGFERLLQAGFTAAEVNQLRLQFRSIQESRFTPDNMPSPDSLRNMEENWLDNNQGGPGGGGQGRGGQGAGGGEFGGGMLDSMDGGGGGGGTEEEFGLPGLMDIMVRGMLIGFLFPLGSAGWLSREEGLWSRKWQVFVSFGIVLSLTIGTIKTLAGE